MSATHHDAEHEQAYRELVELIGVDTGEPGEDGVDDIIPVELTADVVKTTMPSQSVRTLPAATLDEDSHPFFVRGDEIQALSHPDTARVNGSFAREQPRPAGTDPGVTG